MIIKGIVKHFGELIKKAEESIREKMDNGLLDTESSITDRFLQGIESIFDEYGKRNGIYFRARSLRDRGPNAPEKKFGADFCGVLDVRLRELELSKGFLVQAKRETGRKYLDMGVFHQWFELVAPASASFDEPSLRILPLLFCLVLIRPPA